MIRLILQIHCDVGDAAWEYDFAYVRLSIRRIEEWLKRIAYANRQLLANTDFCSMEFWNYEANYCSAPPQGFEELFGNAWTERYESEQWNIEPESFNPPSYAVQRTECDLLTITSSDLWWTALPKHGDVRIATPQIRIADLREFLDRLRGKHMDSRR